MVALSIIGGVILSVFLLAGSRAGRSSEDEAVSGTAVNALIIIIALSGFLIAAGLFHSGWLFN